MTVAGIVFVVLATSVFTGLASHAVFRAVDVELRRRHLEVGTAIFLQAGVIYAVFLAFVFGQALAGYVEADDAVHSECAALHGVSMLSVALPAAQRAQMARALDTYIDDVIGKEWPTMRQGRPEDPAAEAAQIALIERANTLVLTDPRDVANQGRIIDQLLQAHRSREERVFQAGQGIPAGLWVMALAYCAVLVGLVLFSSIEYAWSHATLSAVFGGLNAITLLACFLLQYPFEGPLRMGPSSFVETRARVQMTLAP